MSFKLCIMVRVQVQMSLPWEPMLDDWIKLKISQGFLSSWLYRCFFHVMMIIAPLNLVNSLEGSGSCCPDVCVSWMLIFHLCFREITNGNTRFVIIPVWKQFQCWVVTEDSRAELCSIGRGASIILLSLPFHDCLLTTCFKNNFLINFV